MEETWNFAMDIGYTLQYIFFPNWASLIFTFIIIVCYVFFRVAFQQFNTRMDEFFEETIAIELKKEVPGCMKVNFLPAIKRNLKDSPYLRSAGKLQTVWITITDGVLTLLRSGSEWPKHLDGARGTLWINFKIDYSLLLLMKWFGPKNFNFLS